MKQVRELIPGKIFTYAGEKFVVLGSKNGGVHVLRAQSGEDRCVFYEGDEGPLNHYGKSTLREHIEQDFLWELIRNGADPDDWIPFNLDLCEAGGFDGYGVLKDVFAAPLTLKEWGMYKDIIPNNGESFCLATPYWDSRVWYVTSENNYNDWHYYVKYGVRPQMILKSFVLVSVDGEDEEGKDIDLTKVNNKALIEEFNRRFSKGFISLTVNDLKGF